jgi:hypothetical protein
MNGHRVRVLDDNFRGSAQRLAGLEGDFEISTGDIRDPAAVRKASTFTNAPSWCWKWV